MFYTLLGNNNIMAVIIWRILAKPASGGHPGGGGAEGLQFAPLLASPAPLLANPAPLLEIAAPLQI